MRILLVEDTDDVAEAIGEHFRTTGHAMDRASTIEQGLAYLRAASNDEYDLLLLDVMLPDGSGEVILSTLREAKSALPVVVLTARSQVSDRVQFLDLGADDYVTKPFHFDELDARCRAVLRRHSGKPDNLTRIGRLEFDATFDSVWCDGSLLKLRSRELRVLELFLRAPTRVHSKAFILEKLFDFDDTASENAIEVYVGRLRRKLMGSGVGIETVRGIGYRLTVC